MVVSAVFTFNLQQREFSLVFCSARGQHAVLVQIRFQLALLEIVGKAGGQRLCRRRL
jgi:hypothetical protein